MERQKELSECITYVVSYSYFKDAYNWAKENGKLTENDRSLLADAMNVKKIRPSGEKAKLMVDLLERYRADGYAK